MARRVAAGLMLVAGALLMAFGVLGTESHSTEAGDSYVEAYMIDNRVICGALLFVAGLVTARWKRSSSTAPESADPR